MNDSSTTKMQRQNERTESTASSSSATKVPTRSLLGRLWSRLGSYLLVLLLAMLVLNALGVWPSSGGGGPKVGSKAPAMVLPLLGGGEFSLVESMERGEAVILGFWGTFCPTCGPYLNALDDFHQSLPPDSNIRVYAVNLQGVEQDRQSELVSYMKRRGVSLPVLLDGGQAALDYNVRRIPLTVVVDAAGEVVAVRSGSLNRWSLGRMSMERAVNRL